MAALLLLAALATASADPQIATNTGSVSVFVQDNQCRQPLGPDVWLYQNSDGTDCAPFSDVSFHTIGSSQLQCQQPSNSGSAWRLTIYSDENCSNSVATISGTGVECMPVNGGSGNLLDSYGTSHPLSSTSVYVDCSIYNSDRSFNSHNG